MHGELGLFNMATNDIYTNEDTLLICNECNDSKATICNICGKYKTDCTWEGANFNDWWCGKCLNARYAII